MKLSRREILKAFAAGGIVTAAGLLVPSTKLISIPSGKVFGNEYGIDSTFRLLDRHTVVYSGQEDKIVSTKQFIEWIKKNAAYMMKESPDDMTIHFKSGFRMDNPEHLHTGTLAQDSCREAWMTGNNHRELWSHFGSFGSSEDEFIIDKVYTTEHDRPRERITENDIGLVGYR